MADWSLEDPNPDAYTRSLDAMARAAPLLASDGDDEGFLAGAERLVSMAIEVDTWGPMVQRAVDELTDPATLTRLIELLGDAPSGNQVVERAWARAATLDDFEHLARDPGIDVATLHTLAGRLGEAAIDTLLDVVSEAEELAVRRHAFDVLVRIGGPHVGPRAARRLEDPRWFVQRNMLALLVHFRPRLGAFDLTPWATHEDPRVRREALALLLLQPDHLEEAVPLALAEDDERVVRLALERMSPEAPESVRHAVIDLVLLDPSRSDVLRKAAVKSLAGCGAPDVAHALIEVAADGRTLLGRPRIAAPTEPVLEALRVLATVWRDDPEARRVVDQAGRSRDPSIRAAVQSTTPPEPQGGEEPPVDAVPPPTRSKGAS